MTIVWGTTWFASVIIQGAALTSGMEPNWRRLVRTSDLNECVDIIIAFGTRLLGLSLEMSE